MFNSIRLICLLLMLSLSIGCMNRSGERPYVIYPTIEDARIDGAFQRGWLPEWMPNNAYNIHEYHDLDTNARGISFAVSDADKFLWPVGCTVAAVVPKMSMLTKLSPPDIHKLDGIKTCDDLFVLMDGSGIIHIWTNSYSG